MDLSDDSSVAQLTAAMKRGDEAAWRSFHHAYFNRLFRYHIVLQRGDEDRAADLVQQTMLRVVRHIRRFNDETAFWAWLACLARCAAADEGRSRTRRMRYMEQLAHMTEQRRNSDDAATEQLSALEKCLESLSGEDRALIEGKYYARHSYADLAEQFSISAKAVESKLARIRSKLRDAMKYSSEGGSI
ncbi:MAG: sigma-70 family RNA polymerase sigma factor [Pontiellaceae bacterium]|nr:sigma-70 family RNA polymerase sigma factor [Pontiellaceae bacterium]